MDKKQEACRKLSGYIPEIVQTNPYWNFHDEQIWSRSNGLLTDSNVIRQLPFLPIIRDYFKFVYDHFGTEAQVVVVKASQAGKLSKLLPRLPSPDSDFVLVVLPQTNTEVNSIVPEDIWQKYIVQAGIVPFTRIHSHHVFHAYQSQTDHDTLNSGSLEIVIGDLNTNPKACLWLDSKGKKKLVDGETINSKDFTFTYSI